jgi:hypothetical protein
MRFLAPPHQWFLKSTFLKTELWVYAIFDGGSFPPVPSSCVISVSNTWIHSVVWLGFVISFFFLSSLFCVFVVVACVH